MVIRVLFVVLVLLLIALAVVGMVFLLSLTDWVPRERNLRGQTVPEKPDAFASNWQWVKYYEQMADEERSKEIPDANLLWTYESLAETYRGLTR